MKSAFTWTLQNAWNLFGAIGVVGTFYFSLVHVPDYVKEINASKVSVIHESLIDNLQEFYFNEQAITVDDINSFIKGKELKYGVSYPYNSDELLVQIQDRFMDNKFIPLAKREYLLDTIKNVRATYTAPVEMEVKEYDTLNIMSWVASGLGMLAAVAGGFSLYRKIRYDSETETDIASVEEGTSEYHSTAASTAFKYDNMVGDVLEEMGALQSGQESQHDYGIDYIASSSAGEFVVQTKNFKKLVGVGTVRSFIYGIDKLGKNGILIISSGVTQRSRQLIEEHNKRSMNCKVYLVISQSKDDLRKKLSKILSRKESAEHESKEREQVN